MTVDLEKYFESAPSAWKENRAFANWLVERVKPKTILDLGVDWGHSTICWAEKGVGKVYGVDLWEPNDVCTGGKHLESHVIPAFKSFHQQGMTNIELIKGSHIKVHETWDKPIDILHFDIAHTYDGLVSEYNLWKDKLANNGVVVFHDLLSFPDGAGRFFKDYLTGARVSFNNQFGLGVITDNLNVLNDIVEQFDVEKIY